MKRIERYKTPKEYQRAYNKNHHAPGKRRFECKKLRGSHNFELSITKEYIWKPLEQGKKTVMKTFACKGCGKQKVEFTTETI